MLNTSPQTDDALREELRSLLGQRVDLKLRLLLGEREKQLERLRKIDDQVERYGAGRLEMKEVMGLLTAEQKEKAGIKARGKKGGKKGGERKPRPAKKAGE